jgi:hypothetical protein
MLARAAKGRRRSVTNESFIFRSSRYKWEMPAKKSEKVKDEGQKMRARLGISIAK